MNFFENIEVGTRVELGRHTFTAAEIVEFARAYDPQPFHVDDAAARRGPFGALCASGWHTAAHWMRLLVEHKQKVAAELKAKGLPSATGGPSPGFTDMRWLKPVYAGDTISYATEVTEKVASRSKPGWGIVKSLNTGTNQHGDLVFQFEGAAFLEKARP